MFWNHSDDSLWCARALAHTELSNFLVLQIECKIYVFWVHPHQLTRCAIFEPAENRWIFVDLAIYWFLLSWYSLMWTVILSIFGECIKFSFCFRPFFKRFYNFFLLLHRRSGSSSFCERKKFVYMEMDWRQAVCSRAIIIADLIAVIVRN